MKTTEKPKLYQKDLQDLKRAGRNWMATCPQCGTHHLSVNLEKGLYHCFYAGCGYSGMFQEKREELARQHGRHLPGKPKGGLSFEPDHRILSHEIEGDYEIFRGGYEEQMERDADKLHYLQLLEQYS